MTSGADDDRLASPDVYRLGTIIDVAVLPEAFQTSSGLRIEPRRIAGPDTHNAARELLLANNLVHVAVEYRSEEHTSELQSHHDLVCRLLLEKKKKNPQKQNAQRRRMHGI